MSIEPRIHSFDQGQLLNSLNDNLHFQGSHLKAQILPNLLLGRIKNCVQTITFKSKLHCLTAKHLNIMQNLYKGAGLTAVPLRGL